MAIKSRAAGSPQKDPYQTELRRRVKHFKIVWLFALLLFSLIILRLIDLQVVSAKTYQDKAKKSRSQSLVIYNRGRILDRNGVILAQDSILYDVFSHPRYYYKTPPSEIAAALSPVLDIPAAELEKKLQLPYDTIALKKNITKAEAKKVQALQLPGVECPRKMVRRYPQGRVGSHLIGYVNDDASISTGVEKTAEKILRTPPNLSDVELSGRGTFINVHNMNPELITNLPKTDDVSLTIDSRIQYAAEAALEKGLTKNKAKRGAAIVMNPRNGELLAFAILPDFNPEKYHKEKPENLKNWAITDVYPPGSTFKILTVASGLETGVINENSRLHDTGYIKMGGFTIKNYDYGTRGAPGNIDLVYLFQHSSNIGSLLISLMMTPEDHHRVLKQFGLGSKTNIDIPGESAGIMHPPKQWDELTHATIGFGYGLASTPIQMASAVASIANDGVWVTPHIMRGAKHIERRRVLSEKTAATVTRLLAESIETADSSTVRLQGFRVAGKTGTSRKPSENGRGYSSDVFTSFVGYFPAENPEVLIMVVVDSPGVGNAWGSTVAGPIFHELATQTAGYLGMQPTTVLAGDNSKQKQVH